MAGVMMLPAVALLGWTVKARASGPVPPPPPPPIASPPLLVSRRSYGQAAVRSAATATVTYENLMPIKTCSYPPPLRKRPRTDRLSGPHMIVEGSVRRKSPGDAFVHFACHVDSEIPHTARDSGRPPRRPPRREPPVVVGEPGGHGLEHPGLHLDGRLRDDDPAYGALRREPDRHFDRPVGRVHTHEPERPDRRGSRRAPVEHEHAVIGTPVYGLVQSVGVCAAQVDLAGHVGIGPRQERLHGVGTLDQHDDGSDMEQRGDRRRANKKVHGVSPFRVTTTSGGWPAPRR